MAEGRYSGGGVGGGGRGVGGGGGGWAGGEGGGQQLDWEAGTGKASRGCTCCGIQRVAF